MADEILAQVQELFEGQIDFEGQRQAEWLSTVLIMVTGVIAFIAGFVKQDVWLSLFVGMGGALVTFIAVVPPWSFYNQNPQKWLSTARQSAGVVSKDGKAGTNALMFDGQVLTI